MTALARFQSEMLGVLRIVTGLLFMQHGVQKFFGWLGGDQVELMSLMGLAGVLETFGGLLIVLGLLTRPVAFVLAGEMAYAYFTVHLPQGFWPINNLGELAALFCFVYLYLLFAGPGRFSLDGLRQSAAAVAAEEVSVGRAA